MADSNDNSSGKIETEDVTAKATEENKKKKKIVNKAKNYKAYWEDIQEEEQRMTGDMPNFKIYISYERVNGEDYFKVDKTEAEKKEEDTENDEK